MAPLIHILKLSQYVELSLSDKMLLEANMHMWLPIRSMFWSNGRLDAIVIDVGIHSMVLPMSSINNYRIDKNSLLEGMLLRRLPEPVPEDGFIEEVK